MLPRITTALQNFIKPISPLKKSGMSVQASSETGVGSAGNKENHQQSKPKLKLVPNPEEQKQDNGSENHPEKQADSTASIEPPIESSDESLQASDSVSAPQPNEKSVTQTFLQLFDSLKNTKDQVLKWVAKSSYQAGIKRQKKGAKAKKGALLDENF